MKFTCKVDDEFPGMLHYFQDFDSMVSQELGRYHQVLQIIMSVSSETDTLTLRCPADKPPN